MRRFVAALAVAAVVVGVAGLALSEGEVQAAQFTMEGTAIGAEEVPAVTTSPGTARVRFVFDDVPRSTRAASPASN